MYSYTHLPLLYRLLYRHFTACKPTSVPTRYPGRASISPVLDLFATLLHLGAAGWRAPTVACGACNRQTVVTTNGVGGLALTALVVELPKRRLSYLKVAGSIPHSDGPPTWSNDRRLRQLFPQNRDSV